MVLKSHIKKTWPLFLAFMFISSLLFPADFTVNANRFDPYKQCKFRVKWDGKYVPGILTIDGLEREYQVIDTTGAQKRAPGREVYKPVTMTRTRTHDTAFEQWAQLVIDSKGGGTAANFRKDIIIELQNEAGQIVMAFRVYGCWPSKYSAVERFDANKTEVAVESMVLEYEGWERDKDVMEPAEPAY